MGSGWFKCVGPSWTVIESRSMMPRLDFNDSHHLARMEKAG